MDALFSSLSGGNALRQRVLETVAEASDLAASHHVDLHVMTFAFTDPEIASALVAAAKRQFITIRILADWSQRNRMCGHQVGRLVRLGLPNLRVRYTCDQPYVWNDQRGQMRWSYRASRGLLHHKSLIVLRDRRPWQLLIGSFNWTVNASSSYENLLDISADRPASQALISRLELEFEALWEDGNTTLSPSEARQHYQVILGQYCRDTTLRADEIMGLQGEGEALDLLDAKYHPSANNAFALNLLPRSEEVDPSLEIAFSSPPGKACDRYGRAEVNRMQRLVSCKTSGRPKSFPLSITNLSLDLIGSALPGETLKIAMYGLSPRVPEFGALLEASRRGVRLFVLLDRSVGVAVSARLAQAKNAGKLPIEVRTAGRMMHQKYVVNVESGALFTGSANLSTDASNRHFEHRLRVTGCPGVTARFCADFDEIWRRLELTGEVTLS